jgi:uncharacterized protein YyaL (SSP411 family)
MRTKQTARSRITSLISSGSWAGALLVAASIGGHWFVRTYEPGRETVALAAVLALAAVVSVTWQRSRARARSRWQAALEAYAEREISRERQRKALKRARVLSAFLGIASSVDEHVESRRLAA